MCETTMAKSDEIRARLAERGITERDVADAVERARGKQEEKWVGVVNEGGSRSSESNRIGRQTSENGQPDDCAPSLTAPLTKNA